MALTLAAQRNSMGVTYLTKGDCQRAFSFFNEALQGCSIAAHEAESAQESSMLDESDYDDATAVVLLPQNMEVSQCTSDWNPEDQSISLFNQPLLFSNPKVQEPGAVPGTSVVSFCTAVVMFNMALSLCQGNFSRRQKSVKGATHLFDCAVNLMEQLPVSCSQMLVSVAALNNKACIYYHVDDLKQSKRDVTQLMETLSMADGLTSLFDVDFFVLGAVCVQGTQVARAA